MDVLSSVIEACGLQGLIYDKVRVAGAWGISMQEDSNSQFWRLVKGSCVLGFDDNEVYQLNEGDLVYIANGKAHWIANDVKSERVPAQAFVAANLKAAPMFQSGNDEVVLIGGHFNFDPDFQHPFIKALPKLVHVNRFETENQLLLKQIGGIIAAELSHQKPGSHYILAGLAKMVFINIIRAYLDQEQQTGFLAALCDPQISESIQCMHQYPERGWNLEGLAKSVGMSRSVYFNKFKLLLGETPMNYLTSWRIRKAQGLLLKGKENVEDVSAMVGYSSVAAFTRVFKSKVGLTPAKFRMVKSA